MASIRTLTFGPKDNPYVIKWNTGKLNELVYDNDEIKNTYLEYADEFRKLGSYYKYDIYHKFIELLRTGKYDSQQRFINLLCAMKRTVFSGPKIEFSEFTDPELGKIMFWNIAWHLNNNPKQHQKYMHIRITDWGIPKFVTLCGSEYDDQEDSIYAKYLKFDSVDIRKTEEAKSKRKYARKKQ